MHLKFLGTWDFLVQNKQNSHREQNLTLNEHDGELITILFRSALSKANSVKWAFISVEQDTLVSI
jgi:hypothetical protein